MNVERQHQFPARLVRPRDSIERERNRNPNVGTRRKWTSDEEAA